VSAGSGCKGLATGAVGLNIRLNVDPASTPLLPFAGLVAAAPPAAGRVPAVCDIATGTTPTTAATTTIITPRNAIPNPS
jgi:hypothetical protein